MNHEIIDTDVLYIDGTKATKILTSQTLNRTTPSATALLSEQFLVNNSRPSSRILSTVSTRVAGDPGYTIEVILATTHKLLYPNVAVSYTNGKLFIPTEIIIDPTNMDVSVITNSADNLFIMLT